MLHPTLRECSRYRPLQIQARQGSLRKVLFVGQLVSLIVGLVVPDAVGQTTRTASECQQSTAKSSFPAEAAQIDHWTLQTLGEVSIDSPIVRLKDIVLPIGISDAAWEELGPTPVTLVPTDGRRLTIERQRLLDFVQRHLTPEQRVRWSGPELIYVQYTGDVREISFSAASRPAPPDMPSNTVRKISAEKIQTDSRVKRALQPPTVDSETTDDSIRKMSYQQSASGDTSPRFGEHSPGATDNPEFTTLPAREVERLSRLIESAITAQWPEMAKTCDFQIDPHHRGLRNLSNLRRVDTLRLNEPLRMGSQLVQIDGTTLQDTVTAQIQVHAHPRPEGVFVRNSIRRGQRIQRHDLEHRPLSRSQVADDLVEKIDQIVGMEVRSGLHPNRPVRRGDVTTPTVIHRGDLVEVRVDGGGVIVRSNAKAMDDGSAGELIEVETQQPRKRLMARVVQSGQVEILTRAPTLAR